MEKWQDTEEAELFVQLKARGFEYCLKEILRLRKENEELKK